MGGLGGGGMDEKDGVWVSRGVKTGGVARLALRGQEELSSSSVQSCQVITVDLHLKDGAVKKRNWFYKPQAGSLYCPFNTLLSEYFYQPVV